MSHEERRRHREMQDNERKGREELERKYVNEDDGFDLDSDVGIATLQDEQAEAKGEELDD